jgi:LPS export ABC transporter protein LptC
LWRRTKFRTSFFYKKLIINTLKQAFILIFFVFLTACKNQPADTLVVNRDQVGIERGKDVEIIYSDSARIKVRVTGPTMLYYTNRSDPKQVFTNGTKTYFYDDNQLEMGVLSGKYAIRDERKRQVIVRDSVVWESKTDGRLETSELIWDEATNTIKSTKFTKITRAKETITGYNFQTDDKLSRWQILAPRGEFQAGNLNQAVSQ